MRKASAAQEPVQLDAGGKQHRRRRHSDEDHAGHVGLLVQQEQHHHQNNPVGHQLQQADSVQHRADPTGQGALAPLFGRSQLAAPLGQPGGEVENYPHLGHLGGLKADAEQVDPPAHIAVAGGAAQGGEHQSQQHDGAPQGKHRHPAELLIVDFGNHEHGHHAQHRKAKLPLEIVQRVPLGVHRRVKVVHGGGVGGGQHHDQADGGEQHHQGQEGQVDGPPGQLLFNGQVAFCFFPHGVCLLSSECAQVLSRFACSRRLHA